jgi:hypothetical protein
MIMGTDVIHLLAKFFCPLFFLIHFLFPKGFFCVGHQKFFRQWFLADAANLVFTTINRGVAIWAAKFHGLNLFQWR